MSKTSFFKKGLDFIAKQSTEHMGDIIILTTAGGWLASSTAQLIGIKCNKKYTKEQKSFMVPQEMADAASNIFMFLLITQSLKKVTSKMVQTGKLAPKSIVSFLKKIGLDKQRGKFDFDITKIEDFGVIRSKYNSFKCFAESAAAITGGVFSSNIVTPVIRNFYASKRKGKVLDRINNRYPNTVDKNTQVNPMTKRYTFDEYRQRVLSLPTKPQI